MTLSQHVQAWLNGTGPDEVIWQGSARLRFQAQLHGLDPLLAAVWPALANFPVDTLPVAIWLEGTWPMDDDVNEELEPCVRAIVAQSTAPLPPPWEEVVPGHWVRTTNLFAAALLSVSRTAPATDLSMALAESLRVLALPNPILDRPWTWSVGHVFRARVQFKQEGRELDVLQWHGMASPQDTAECIQVLRALARGLPNAIATVTLSNDSNIYGRLPRQEREALLEPWATEGDARAFELNLDARRHLRLYEPPEELPMPTLAKDSFRPWTRPMRVKPGYEALYDAVSVAARLPLTDETRPRVHRAIPTAWGGLDLTYPLKDPQGDPSGHSRILLVTGWRWAAGVHREDQPWLAARMDDDMMNAFAIMGEAARDAATDLEMRFTAVVLWEMGLVPADVADWGFETVEGEAEPTYRLVY